jgi:ABC-type molybdate transport system substrate-binding protein
MHRPIEQGAVLLGNGAQATRAQAFLNFLLDE